MSANLIQHYHAKNMFDAELNWALGDFLSNNLFYKNSFLHIFEKSYYWMIKQTGLETMLKKILIINTPNTLTIKFSNLPNFPGLFSGLLLSALIVCQAAF
jgi:hypothetical protein